jgi:hypothetical protein
MLPNDPPVLPGSAPAWLRPGTVPSQRVPPPMVRQIVAASPFRESSPRTNPCRRLTKITWEVPPLVSPSSGRMARQCAPPSAVTSSELRSPARYPVPGDTASICPR